MGTKQREQRSLDALDGGGDDRHRGAGRVGRVMDVLDLGGDIVGEEARHE